MNYVYLAPGFEEVEALTVVDVMRRAGMEVKTIAVTGAGKAVTGAHGVTVEADVHVGDVDVFGAEWLVCPGGMPGATNLAACSKVTEALLVQAGADGKVAAICASPAVVLAPLGILEGCEYTCYPGFEKGVTDGVYKDRRVVALDNLITANGPSSSLPFALAIVANSLGQAKAKEVADGMLV